ncbi:hypothetical protein [Halotalea alkalilenta]|nr:hypothetical protein [Halotalea alkalilenta]
MSGSYFSTPYASRTGGIDQCAREDSGIFFETKEDGTIIYHGKFRDRGYIVTEKIKSKLLALYSSAFGIQFFVIFPAFSTGHYFFGLFLGGLIVMIFYFIHRRLVKNLPLSPYPRQRLPQRAERVGREAPLWLLLFSLPFLFMITYFLAWHFFTQDDQKALALSAMIFFILLDMILIVTLVIKTRLFLQSRKKR